MVLDIIRWSRVRSRRTFFVLRPVRASDAGLIAHHAGDRRVAEATQNIPHPFPPGAAEAFVARAIQHERPGSVWVLDGALTGLSEVLGVISLKPMEVKAGQGGQSEVAYWVAPAFWNTGIASEAVRALVTATLWKTAPISPRSFRITLVRPGADQPGLPVSW